MHLTKIKLAGFKSFVDPTVIDLRSNLVAILGPNGCGKSNTIDAVRWVMGESSAKNLRGGQSVDVIFNGSSSRKPVGQATVELVFDNSDGTLGGQYAGFNEISVKRQITRDGESTYFINQVRCRRKDVTDLFLGTGLGPRSYAIVEQGMISRFIEAKPDDLRVYLEEAAGISKYKERRRETENRIVHTRENLARLSDLRQEIDKLLSRLERQSEATKKFQDYQQELSRYQAESLALQQSSYQEEKGQLEQNIREHSTQMEASLALVREAETEIEKNRLSLDFAAENLQQVQRAYYELGNRLSKQESAIQHHQERKQHLQENHQLTESSLNKLKSQLSEDEAKLAAWQAELLNLKPCLSQKAEEKQQNHQALRQAQDHMDDWRLEWDSLSESLLQPSKQSEAQKARLSHLESTLRQTQNRAEKLKQEYQSLDTAKIEAELQQILTTVAASEVALRQKESEIEEFQIALQNHREKMTEAEQALNDNQQLLQVSKGKQASLLALQEASLKQQDQKTLAHLSAKLLDKNPRLANLLKISNGWELALETVLSDRVNAICVDNATDFLNDWPKETQGVTLVSEKPKSFENHATSHGLPALASGIQSGLSYIQDFIQGIFVADNWQSAMTAIPQLKAGQSVVTLEGFWIGTSWMRAPDSLNPKQGVLAREQALAELATLIEDKTEEQNRLKSALQEKQWALKEMEHTREEHQRARNALVRELGTLKAEQGVRQTRLDQMGQRLSRLHQEIQEVLAEQNKAQQESLEARQLLDKAIEQMSDLSTRKEAESRRKQSLEQALFQARNHFREVSDEHQSLERQIERLETQVSALQGNSSRLVEQLKELTEREFLLREELLHHDDPLPQMKQELEDFLNQQIAADSEVRAAQMGVDALANKLRELEQDKNKAAKEQDYFRSEVEKSRLSWQAMQTKIESLEEQLAKTHFTLEILQQNMPAEANLQEWLDRIQRLENSIQRLGPINLAAIQEFEAEKERKQYLDAQDADLNEALAVLEAAIQEIDKETRNRFKETFDKVNQGFQNLFPKLFGGGVANLELTGEDLLDTGVSVMARPPGKKNSLISQLSGGEKALTAVALVFAIFQLNPAPFCMLDEVDAPLDDANVGRFCRLVKEMSETVQFIYITHNKVTMEMADYLMGVTMKEPGVSRLVSVNIEEAVEMAEA